MWLLCVNQVRKKQQGVILILPFPIWEIGNNMAYEKKTLVRLKNKAFFSQSKPPTNLLQIQLELQGKNGLRWSVFLEGKWGMGLEGSIFWRSCLATLHFYLEFIGCVLFLSVIHYALPLVSEFVYDPKPSLTKCCYKH